MNKSHEFYPMITSSVKTIFALAIDNKSDKSILIQCLLCYPLIAFPECIIKENKLLDALIQELNRQYARWNKGGQDAK